MLSVRLVMALIVLGLLVPTRSAAQQIEELNLTVAEFAALDEPRQRDVIVRLHRSEIERMRSVNDEEAGRIHANLIEFLYFSPPARGGESEPPGVNGLLRDIQIAAGNDTWRNKPIFALKQHVLKFYWDRLIAGQDPTIDKQSDEEQMQVIRFAYEQLLTEMASQRAAAAEKAAREKLEAERRALWQEVRKESIRLRNGQLIYLEGGRAQIVPSEPGTPRIANAQERETIWRELRAMASTIPDGRRVVVQDLPNGRSIMLVLPTSAAGAYRTLGGQEASTIWRQMQPRLRS